MSSINNFPASGSQVPPDTSALSQAELDSIEAGKTSIATKDFWELWIRELAVTDSDLSARTLIDMEFETKSEPVKTVLQRYVEEKCAKLVTQKSNRNRNRRLNEELVETNSRLINEIQDLDAIVDLRNQG